MRILLSAMACEPGKGSEPEVGFRAMLAAARRHDVWLLTLSSSVPAILRALEHREESSRIRVIGVDFGVVGDRFERLTATGFHWHYDRWQRDAAARAASLDRHIDFDLVHHVTLASYWTRAGVATLGKPFVWGPVGGGVNPPLCLMSELGPRGLLEAGTRMAARPVLARLPFISRSQEVAAVALVQNRETAARIRTRGRVIVLSNALAVDLNGLEAGPERTKDVMFVGRLVPWKGTLLALRALRHMQCNSSRLRFFGAGGDRHRLDRVARRWGLADRITFEGHVPRDRVLHELSRAGVLVHPSLHDEAALSVAEALTLGTPVVCLDHGGPAQLIRQWPDAPSAGIPLGLPEPTARRMAKAMDAFLTNSPEVRGHPAEPLTSFEDELLRAFEIAVEDRIGGPAD